MPPFSPEILVSWTTWLATMRLGQVQGCRPAINIEGALEALSGTEGSISPKKWPDYLGPTLTLVDARYACCLVATLDKAITELNDPSLNQSHFVGGSESIFLTKLQLQLVPLEEFEAIRDFAAGGAFQIDHRTYGMVRMWR